MSDPSRAVPFYCPYCGEEDIRPVGAKGGVWHCGDCRRSWELHAVRAEASRTEEEVSSR